MAQPPILADQVQIEPGTTTYGTRLIDRDPTDGGLRFTDPNVVMSLLALVGLRNLTGLFIVGRAGDGAPYTTIQDAIDAVPDTSSTALPSLVLVGPGEYTENLVIEKNGVILAGMGRPRITASSGATVTISDTALSTPKSVVLRDLVIENTGAGEEALLISGAGTFASGTVTVVNAPLAAGDTIVIGGTTLLGVTGARSSGADDFSVDATTAALLAIEIAAAINDSLNSFAATVSASESSGVVTITANTPGVGGNTITLSVTTTPAGGLTISGATLTGGSSAGSPVGEDGIDILGCDLIASGNAGLTISADTINNIRVEGGTWRGSAANAKALIVQCASFRVSGVEWVSDLELSYDDSADQPVITTSEYLVSQCGRVGAVLSNILGTGSLTLLGCPNVGDITAGGDKTLDVVQSAVGAVTLSDTLVATLSKSSRGVASVAGGTPTLEESLYTGSVVFAASALEVVNFEVPAPDTSYAVLLDCPDPTAIPQATVKAAVGFTLTTPAPITGTVFYTVSRQM